MSEENVKIIQAGFEALNRQDLNGMFELADPECEIDMSRAEWGPYRGVHSIERFRSIQEEIIEGWGSARWEPAEYIDLGVHVVVPVTGHFQGRDGIELQAEMTWVYKFRDGEIRRVTLYQKRDEALEAAGLSE